jgi:purine nucleoside permease
MRPRFFVAALAIALVLVTGRAHADDQTLRPKVVIVVYFEVGRDTGDKPGELQQWVERDHLTRVIDVPGMSRGVRANADGSEIAVTVGPGQIRPAANVMALGNDPRFDLRASYWLINGIAGVSPHDGSLASAFWTDYVINGEWAHELDAREIPRGWSDGFVALGTSSPGERRSAAGSANDVRTWPATGAHIDDAGAVVRLNPHLLRWAYEHTKAMTLPATPAMRQAELLFRHDPAAAEPARVRIGANIATETFWHGAKMDAWAHRWVTFMTDGRAKLATTAENDSGTLVALYSLTQSGRANWNRALVLRTCSNFDMQNDNQTAPQSLYNLWHGTFPAYFSALDMAYNVGHRVVALLMSGHADRE